MSLEKIFQVPLSNSRHWKAQANWVLINSCTGPWSDQHQNTVAEKGENGLHVHSVHMRLQVWGSCHHVHLQKANIT